MSVIYINSYLSAPALEEFQFQDTYSATANDGYTTELDSGFSYTGVAVQCGINGSASYNAFFWFDNITIPQGATITTVTFNLERRGDNRFI